MSKVNVSTSQNVSLEFTLANIGDRIIACIIDLAIQALYILVAVTIVTKMSDPDSATNNESQGIVLYLVMVPIFLYSFLFELLFNGQTIGKMIMKTRVIREDGLQPNIGNYFLRWVLRIVDIGMSVGVVGIISASMSPKWQRLGDLAAGTIVIKLKRKVRLEDTLYVEYNPNYVVEFKEAARLTDNNISLIKEVLVAYEKEDNYLVLDSMSQRLKEVLNIDYMGSNEEFLQVVIKDYAHIYQTEK